MHILSREIGLISITLAQSGMDCALTRLPDHRWQRSSRPSLEKCLAGVCESHSDYRSRSGVFYHIHFTSRKPLTNSFLRKNELPSSHSEHRDYGKLQAVTERECGLLSQGCLCHGHTCLFSDWNITLREMKVTPRCIDWRSMVSHGRSQWVSSCSTKISWQQSLLKISGCSWTWTGTHRKPSVHTVTTGRVSLDFAELTD